MSDHKDNNMNDLVEDFTIKLLEQWKNPKKILDIVYRPWSPMFYEEIKKLKSTINESYHNETEREILKSDIGEFGLYESEFVPLDIPIPHDLFESKEEKKVLNKPKRGGSKKFYVYVKDPKSGNIKKVSFGAKGMSVGIDDPDRRASFVARHDCKNKNDKTKPSYWSCRLPRYWKALGLKQTSYQYW